MKIKEQYNGKLKKGMKVILIHDKRRESATIIKVMKSGNRAECHKKTADYRGWVIERRHDGYWGGNCSDGDIMLITWKYLLSGGKVK